MAFDDLQPRLTTAADTATAIRGDRAAGRRILQILGDRFRASYPLAGRGAVTIGRASDNLVALDDPEISRHHLVLHLGDALTLEDLGSANGTRVGERAMAPGSTVELQPGQLVEIGTTFLLVQSRFEDPVGRRAWPYDYFEVRVAEQCRRAERTGAAFIVVHVCVTPVGRSGSVERRLLSQPELDVVARYVPGEYQILVVDPDPADADATVQRLRPALADAGVTLRLGAARFPEDGRSVDDLLTTAAMRAAGASVVTGDPDASLASRGVQRLTERLGPGSIPVLVTGAGEAARRGVAEALHRHSGRATLEYVIAATLDPAQLEARLRVDSRTTIVIDELTALPESTQPQLARWLSGERRGPRIVALSRVDLEDAVAVGRLRPELFFVLQGAWIDVPPQRMRADARPKAELAAPTVEPLQSVKDEFQRLERERIVAALNATRGNQTAAAKVLGISRRTLIKRLDAYGLPRPRKGQ